MNFEPQCNTRADLHREMARVLDMCKDFTSDSGYPLSLRCVRYNGSVPPHHDGLPHLYMENIDKYEFALELVEGKPVFRDSEMYRADNGWRCHWNDAGKGWQDEVGFWQDENDFELSWNPPQRTIEINGVKVKEPVSSHIVHCLENNRDISHYEVRVRIETEADAEAFKAAMEGKK